MREVKRTWNRERTSLDVYVNEGVHRWSLHVTKAANGEWQAFGFYSNNEDEWNIDHFCRNVVNDEAAEKLADEFIQEFGRG